MEIIRSKSDIATQRSTERINADNTKLKANIDYLAMMSDIDIPVEDESEDKHDE
jgi:hypothetical protein